jgi:hypothetical protein
MTLPLPWVPHTTDALGTGADKILSSVQTIERLVTAP